MPDHFPVTKGPYKAATFLSDAPNTRSVLFSLLICLDATKFVLPSVFTLTERIYAINCSNSGLKSAKSPLPVDLRRSITSLLKIPNGNKLCPATEDPPGFDLSPQLF